MGRAMSIRFAKEGAKVVVAEVDETSGKETFDEIKRQGLLVGADISKVSEIDALISKTISNFGRIDIMVNNAGVTKSLGFFDVTEADWDAFYAVNSRGLFFCMQRAAREMVKQKSGKIINIASIAGKGFRGTSNIAYAGTKISVLAMTRIAESQLTRYNINVNAICPGATRTTISPTWRRSWPHPKPTISPGNRTTSTAASSGIDRALARLNRASHVCRDVRL